MRVRFALYSLAVVGLTGCPSIGFDEDPEQPVAEFDPANRIIPFPNNLLLDRATGRVNLPAQCNESPTAKALREGVLNKLDGFGTYQPAINLTFTAPVDLESLKDHAVLVKRATRGTAVDPTKAQSIPVVPIASKATRFNADCSDSTSVEQITFIPALPLEQRSTYVFALVDGVTGPGGPLTPSSAWALVREPEPVVVFDDAGNYVSDRTPLDPAKPEDLVTLRGIDQLWKAHAPALAFLAQTGRANASVLVATEFTTQTTTEPLDTAIAGSPASKLAALPLLGNQSLTAAAANRTAPYDQCVAADTNTQCYLKVTLGAGNYATGSARCAQLGCAAIGDVVGSLVMSKQYQLDVPAGAITIPGPWSDPRTPMVVHDVNTANPLASDAQAKLGALVMIPATAAPASGYPTVVFQHGLGRSRTDAFAIAGRLASQGFATVAIDAVGHDSRAVRISSDAARGCANPTPTTAPQCYAPFLSPNLAATRDGIRQTVLDHHQLVTSLKACGTTNCGALKVDASRIFYMGQSLGGIIGGVTASLRSDINAAVLNVPGFGWADILENTATLQIRCSLVDGLIDAGILTGAKSDVVAKTGLCMGDDWKTQPGYRQFAVIGRWVLDSADPANFAPRLATKKLLVQRVDKDQVVPNIATDRAGALIALAPARASCGVPNASGQFAASQAITTNPTANKLLDYVTVAPGDAACAPGNTFAHGSLLSPAVPTNDGTFATAQMQTDAITFLSINK